MYKDQKGSLKNGSLSKSSKYSPDVLKKKTKVLDIIWYLRARDLNINDFSNDVITFEKRSLSFL